MNPTFLLSLALILSAISSISAADEKRSFRGNQVFRLFPETLAQRAAIAELQHKYNFWSQMTLNEPIDIHVEKHEIPNFLQLLEPSKIAYEIAIHDVQELIDKVEAQNDLHRARRSAENGADSIVGRFASYDEIVNWARGLCLKFSHMAACGLYGWSSEGRQLVYMRFGNAPMKSKNAIFIEGGMHADEWIAHHTAIYIVDRLLNTYSTDPVVRNLLDNWNFYYAVLSNPDGYEYTRKVDRTWRKTRSNHTTNKYCRGTDPNRNYDSYWATVGSSSSPCSNAYHGEGPFSVPEAKGIANIITARQSEILAYFVMHAAGNKWLIPYGYAKDTKPSDYAELLRVAEIGIKAIAAVNNQTWWAGNSADIMYPCGGASDDWVKENAGIKYSYTIEHRPRSGTSPQGHIRPESEIEKSGREIFAGLVAAINAMKP